MKRLPALLVPFAALLLLAATAHRAAAQDGLLPVAEAFKVQTKALDRERVQFDFTIADDYYLYRDRVKVKAADASTLAALDLPPGEPKHDEYLGDVEVYHHAFSAVQHLSAPAGQNSVALELRYQGCHQVDPKICFPPQKVVLHVDLPAADAAAATPGGVPNLAAPPGASLLGNEPLPAEKAYVFEAIATAPDKLLARFTMPKGYYLYRDKTHFRADNASLGAPEFPPGKEHTDANFGTTTVYFDQVEIPLPVKAAAGATSVALTADFQGCLEGSVCYPVMTRTVSVTLPAGNASGPAMSALPEAAPAQQARPDAATVLSFGTLLAALGGALVGGLILNLMPCVLPVLSLKAISILEGGESPQKARAHVLYYTAGVMLTFAAVGLAVIGLRAAGLIYGWGFQLQQPLFVAVLVYVVLAIGLSLSGVVQFGVGLTNTGQGLAARSGPSGDFFTGVLAVVVASPCTAPFMGSALAFALTSAPWVAFLVFITLGLGLALPFLLIGFVPALGRFLPRPGAWMDTLKQVLAYPMYLTAVWLVWVLGNQRGVDAIGLVLVGAVVLTWACWWFERHRYGSNRQRAFALVVALLALMPLYEIAHLAPKAAAATATAGQVPFNPAKLEELRRSGKSVFVDIGADWCTTCKVNEHAVLATDAFRELVKRTDTVLMVGDWTNPDADIEAFLARFHAVGVPLYVVYRHGDEGHALPTVLTQGIVEAALSDGAH